MDAIYLKLDGIEGESRIKGFENQIKLLLTTTTRRNGSPAKREGHILEG